MRQADITFMAYSMARSVSDRLPQRDDERHFMALHAYALNRRDVDQARQLPSAEVLARKHGEISGTRFAWPSLPAAPRQVQLFWAAFRGAIETLEPFRDETTPAMFPPLEAMMALHTVDAPANPLPGRQQAEDEEPAPGDALKVLLEETGLPNGVELADMARIGKSLMDTIAIVTKDGPLKGWAPAEDPAEIVTDLMNMLHDATTGRAEAEKLLSEAQDSMQRDDDGVKVMVDRFLRWKLPTDFNPDGGIGFTPGYENGTPEGGKFEPTGTNLFDARQATEMVRAMLNLDAPGKEDDEDNAAGDRAIQELIDDGAITVTTTTQMVDVAGIEGETRLVGGPIGDASEAPATPPSTDPGPASPGQGDAAGSSTSRKPSRKKTAAE